jgi:hypothetical protein
MEQLALDDVSKPCCKEELAVGSVVGPAVDFRLEEAARATRPRWDMFGLRGTRA